MFLDPASSGPKKESDRTGESFPSCLRFKCPPRSVPENASQCGPSQFAVADCGPGSQRSFFPSIFVQRLASHRLSRVSQCEGPHTHTHTRDPWNSCFLGVWSSSSSTPSTQTSRNGNERRLPCLTFLAILCNLLLPVLDSSLQGPERCTHPAVLLVLPSPNTHRSRPGGIVAAPAYAPLASTASPPG